MPIHSLLLLQDGHMLFDQAATLGTKCECVWAHDCCFFFSSCEWYSLTVSIRMLTHCKGQRWHLGRLPVRSQRRQMSSGLCELSLKYYTLNTCHHRRKKKQNTANKEKYVLCLSSTYKMYFQWDRSDLRFASWPVWLEQKTGCIHFGPHQCIELQCLCDTICMYDM